MMRPQACDYVAGSSPAATSSRMRWLGRLGVAACGMAMAFALMSGPAQALFSARGSTSAPERATAQGPPPVRLVTESVALRIHPFTSCWSTATSGFCYDGFPVKPLPSIGGTHGPITLAFGRDGWRFRVSVRDSSGEQTSVDLVKTDARHWRLVVKDLPDGRYRADVFGSGPQGDVAAAFAFTLN